AADRAAGEQAAVEVAAHHGRGLGAEPGDAEPPAAAAVERLVPAEVAVAQGAELGGVSAETAWAGVPAAHPQAGRRARASVRSRAREHVGDVGVPARDVA